MSAPLRVRLGYMNFAAALPFGVVAPLAGALNDWIWFGGSCSLGRVSSPNLDVGEVMLAGGLPMMTMPCRGFHSKLSCPAAVALLDLAAGNRETRRLTVTNSTHHSKPWLVVIAHDRRNSHQAGLSLRFYRRPRKSSKFGLPMFGHGHHRKGRLSLPSIRISTAPDLNKSTDSNGAPLDRGLASSQPTGSRPISHDFQTGSTSSALGRHHHHQHHHQHHRDSRGHRKASQGASLSSSSAHDSLRSRHDSGQHTQLLPPFKERPLTEEEREIEHATLFRSLRGDYKPNEDEETHLDQHTAANDPFMPSELIEAIQTSMKNCAEYERQCAQLEHSIEHKILMFSHILEQYEGQDHTATELREMISTAQSALQSTTPTMQSAESTARTAHEKLDEYQRTLIKAREIAERSKETMSALEDHMHDQEIIHDKIAKWQHAMLGTGTALIVVIAILLAWLFS